MNIKDIKNHPQFIEMAKQAQSYSYSPYSKYAVGAVVKAKSSDQIFSGCNVENGSYGATICAERVAITKMVSELKGKPQIEWVALITGSSPPAPPCGLCLQVISEFADGETPILIGNDQGESELFTLNQLFPQRFEFRRKD